MRKYGKKITLREMNKITGIIKQKIMINIVFTFVRLKINWQAISPKRYS